MGKRYTPKYVYNDLDLDRAIRSKETVIISRNEALFLQISNQMKKKETSTKVKKGGSFLQKVGGTAFVVSLFIPGLNGAVLMAELAAAGIGGITKLVGSGLDEFRKYNVIIDRNGRSVVFLRTHGRNAYNLRKDSIVGLDIEKIISTESAK